jgi:glycosyltransferase involved in cell wall biosynthesis
MESSKARILFVTGEYPPLRGGVADYTERLRNEIDRLGHKTYVLASEGAQGPGVFTIGSWSWPVALHIREIINTDPVDVVHIQYQAGAFDMHPAVNALPTALSAWLRVPVVTTFHDLRAPYLFPKAGRLRNAIMLRMARASARVIVTNPGDQRILEQAEIRATRIPLGPSLPLPSNYNGPSAIGRSIGYFGFPSREKGLIDLVDALGRFEETSRPRLELIGATRPDTGTHRYLSDDEISDFARERGVRVERTGFLPAQEASNRLAGCSVVSLPFTGGASQRSSALIAALQLGRPVVTTSREVRDDLDQLADLPQLVTVAPGNPEELHRGLRRALEEEIGSARLPDEYRWDAIGARHSRIYQELSGAAG